MQQTTGSLLASMNPYGKQWKKRESPPRETVVGNHGREYQESRLACGCVSSSDHQGRRFWVVAGERDGAGRFIVRADEKVDCVFGNGIGESHERPLVVRRIIKNNLACSFRVLQGLASYQLTQFPKHL